MIKQNLIRIFESSDMLIFDEIKYRFSEAGIYFEIKDLHITAFYKSGLGTSVLYVRKRDKSSAGKIMDSILSQTVDPDFETITDVGIQKDETSPQFTRKSILRILFFIFLLASLIIISKLTKSF